MVAEGYFHSISDNSEIAQLRILNQKDIVNTLISEVQEYINKAQTDNLTSSLGFLYNLVQHENAKRYKYSLLQISII